MTRRYRELRSEANARRLARQREREGQGAKAPPKAARLAGKATPAPPESATLPDPDHIPADASIEQINRWISQAESAANQAEMDGNAQALAQALRVCASLAETRRKAAPRDTTDPNELPDMVRLSDEVAARLHKMIEQAAQ
jgi:hypothetical protein